MSEIASMFDDIDKEEAVSPPAAPPTPKSFGISSMFDDIDTQKPRAINNLTVAQSVNPDHAAKALKASKDTGIPYPAAEVNLPAAEQSAQLQKSSELLDKSPKLTQQIADNPYLNLLAQDDMQSLATMEGLAQRIRMINEPARIAKETGKSILTGAPSMASDLVYGSLAAVSGVSDQIVQALDDAAATVTGTERRKILGSPGPEGFFLEQQKMAQDKFDAFVGMDKKTAGWWEQRFVNAGKSAGGSLGFGSLGLIKGSGEAAMNAAIGAMAGSQGGQTYGEDRSEGVMPFQSVAHGIQDTVAEYIGEKYLGLGGFMKEVKAGSSAFKLAMYELKKEVPGEVMTTLWQNANKWANVNPEKSAVDFFREQPEAVLETIVETVLGGGMQVGAVKAMQKIAGQNVFQEDIANKAEQTAANMEAMQKTIEASKVLERSQETMRSYAQSLMEDGVSEVYVNAGTLAEAGVNIQELAQILPSIQSQMDQVASNGDFVIPTAELLVNTAGTAYAQPMIDNLRAGADEMSRNDAKTHMQEQGDRINQQIDKVLSGAENTSEFMNQREEVKQALLGEMKGNTPFADKVNEANAMLAATHFAVEAQKLGIPAKELAAKYGLKFQDKTEEKSIQNKEDGEKQLNQRNEALIDMRKRHSVLKSIMKCLG